MSQLHHVTTTGLSEWLISYQHSQQDLGQVGRNHIPVCVFKSGSKQRGLSSVEQNLEEKQMMLTKAKLPWQKLWGLPPTHT